MQCHDCPKLNVTAPRAVCCCDEARNLASITQSRIPTGRMIADQRLFPNRKTQRALNRAERRAAKKGPRP